jgi:hypothetical protein
VPANFLFRTLLAIEASEFRSGQAFGEVCPADFVSSLSRRCPLGRCGSAFSDPPTFAISERPVLGDGVSQDVFGRRPECAAKIAARLEVHDLLLVG